MEKLETGASVRVKVTCAALLHCKIVTLAKDKTTLFIGDVECTLLLAQQAEMKTQGGSDRLM